MELEEVRLKLHERRIDILRRIERIDKDLTHQNNPLSADLREQAQDLTNDEVLMGLDHLERKELQDINMALQKIEDGTYGRCQKCGESISPARLKALVSTHQCVRCAELS